ncbi:ABC transporter permease [Phyllobacterium sophorae]|uniref:ABC transporter permease n=1 Tax=Phyllobacterium sophorae TaxID=1520277 RepID=A0A2P7AQQ9_9HYPH|nr:ABC transporter permease [Phyllobacterium sophorae]PSH56483.1 ABC transporter permease [Phyllobacterium sophorae]
MNWLLLRSGRAILTLLLLLTFTFFTLAASGDPALQKFSPDVDLATIAAFREKWGLNEPIWKQFLIYLERLAHFDFGMSYRTGRPALEVVLDRVPVTLSLAIPSIVLSIVIGIPLGFYAAMNKGRLADRITILVAVMGLAIPPFLLGIFLMYVFSIWLGWLPPSGYVNWTSYIMPVASISAVYAAIFARFTRSAMVEVMSHPMIETAKASGLATGLVQRVHVLPNVLLPLVTITALEFGNVVTFAAVIENLFSWPGAGTLLIEAVAGRDYAVVEAVLLLTGSTMILANFLTDLSYGLIDPRIRDYRRAYRRSPDQLPSPEGAA